MLVSWNVLLFEGGCIPMTKSLFHPTKPIEYNEGRSHTDGGTCGRHRPHGERLAGVVQFSGWRGCFMPLRRRERRTLREKACEKEYEA
jgi:hypothetical protein